MYGFMKLMFEYGLSVVEYAADQIMLIVKRNLLLFYLIDQVLRNIIPGI